MATLASVRRETIDSASGEMVVEFAETMARIRVILPGTELVDLRVALPLLRIE